MNKPKFGVVASVTESDPAKFAGALVIAGLKAPSVEVRLDGLEDEVGRFWPFLSNWPKSTPLILTLRSVEQGGSRVIPLEMQWLLWASLPPEPQSLVADPKSLIFLDWGLDLIQYCQKNRKRQLFPWEKIGASLHYFRETPDDLATPVAALEAAPALAFLKFVTTATRDTDADRVKRLFSGRSDPRPFIAFLMGKLGEDSRRKCLGWGSDATYGYVPGCPRTAPGQIPFTDLLEDPDVRAALV
ncbi:MAG: type I 3-dehydroquinate dehydratase [Patescibacteria group bacterium]